MRKAAFVRLTPEPCAELSDRLEREALNGRQGRHFQILLVVDEGRTDEQIAARPRPPRTTTGSRRTGNWQAKI